MTDDERDCLLIRVDERTQVLKEKVEKVEDVLRVVGNLKADIRFLKQIGGTIATIGSLCIGALEYFRK